jgi:hypothetical protein
VSVWATILELQHPDEGDHYIVRTCKDALGGIRAIASGYRLCGGGAGGQEFRPRVEYRRYGLPDIGVCKAI